MQQRETKEAIIITWKSGLKQVFEKTQLTYDMIVFEYEDIEEMEYSEIVTVKEEPKQEPKIKLSSTQRFVETKAKTIHAFCVDPYHRANSELGDVVLIGDVSYECISIDPLEFVAVARAGANQ